jgi:hypothetical protein
MKHVSSVDPDWINLKIKGPSYGQQLVIIINALGVEAWLAKCYYERDENSEAQKRGLGKQRVGLEEEWDESGCVCVNCRRQIPPQGPALCRPCVPLASSPPPPPPPACPCAHLVKSDMEYLSSPVGKKRGERFKEAGGSEEGECVKRGDGEEEIAGIPGTFVESSVGEWA